MKKITTIALSLVFASFLASCAPQAGLKAGSATAASLVNLLPEATRGVFVFDVHRAMGTDQAAKALKDEESRKKYDEFVKTAGIDPMKDVYFVVVGLAGMPTGKDQEGGVIVNLRYQKDILLGKLKDMAKELQEESYKGVTIFRNFEGSGSARTTRGAFLDDSNILIGSEMGVKGIIDVYQKKAASIKSNAEMSKLLKSVNTSAMAWGAFALPPDLIRKAAESNAQMKVLEGISSLGMSFDYRNKGLLAEIQALGGTEEQNKNLASMLNGFKMLGAAAAAQEPVIGDALNGVEITSGKDFVKLYISLPEEVLDKMQKVAKDKVGSMIQINPAKPKEDKKDETEIKKD